MSHTNPFKCIAGLGALLAVMSLPPGGARAAVIFDNFDTGGGFHPQYNSVAAYSGGSPRTGIRAAARFTVAGSSSPLVSITLPISVQQNTPGDILRVRLAADNGGVPGATIEVLSENQGIWPTAANPFTTTTTLTSGINPLLLAGSSYWIVTEPTSMVVANNTFIDYRWFNNSSGTTVAFLQEEEDSRLPSDPWSNPAAMNAAAFRVDGPSPTDALENAARAGYTLSNSGANPFSGTTTIQFGRPESGWVSLVIYDLAGHRVRTVVDASMGAGVSMMSWDGKNEAGRLVPSGLYFVRMKTNAVVKTQKLALVR